MSSSSKAVQQEYQVPPWGSSLRLLPKHKLRLISNSNPPTVRWHIPGAHCNLWIRRDDTLGMETSGNKIRKLEFLLSDALEKGCDSVITIGGLQSNHCRATAIAANCAGLSCYLLLRLPGKTSISSLSPASLLEGNLLISRLSGAYIKLFTVEERNLAGGNNALLELMASDLRKQGKKPYIIPLGGSNALGTWGYLEAAREIINEMNNSDLTIDDIVVSTGSGGTVGGLALGNYLAKTGIRVHGVCASDNAAYFHEEINQIFYHLGASVKSESICDIIEGYVGEGYGKNSADDYNLLIEIARSTGVILDPVYTLKAVKAILNDPKFKNKNVLFIHTGGLFGLYSHIPLLIPQLQKQQDQDGEHPVVSPLFPKL